MKSFHDTNILVGSSRRKREEEGLDSPTITAPTADAPDPDEGVVPGKDGGVFTNDSMISKPPKQATGTSSNDKLNSMFDDGVRTEDHKQEEQHDTDASSKKLDDESYGQLGDGSKWYKSANGTSKANSYADQEDKKDTEELEATGEDSEGRKNKFKSKKNVRERRQKLGSRSSSHTSSTTMIKGGKNQKKKNKKGKDGKEASTEKPLVSDSDVTPTESSSEKGVNTFTDYNGDEAGSSEPSSYDKSSPTTPGRRKRETVKSEVLSVKTTKSSSSFTATNSNYSFCKVDSIETKYEAFKCQRDCYAKCSPANSYEEQCLDVCFLLRCSLEPPGDERDNCEARCQSSCESETLLRESTEGTGTKLSKGECHDQVTQLLYYYGGFKNEIVAEHCSNIKSHRK